jgi:hypothetical protein
MFSCAVHRTCYEQPYSPEEVYTESDISNISLYAGAVHISLTRSSIILLSCCREVSMFS